MVRWGWRGSKAKNKWASAKAGQDVAEQNTDNQKVDGQIWMSKYGEAEHR